jgi:hypothetical protein
VFTGVCSPLSAGPSEVDSEFGSECPLTFERQSFEKDPLELQVQEDDGRWVVAWVYRRLRNRSSIVLHFGDAVYEGYNCWPLCAGHRRTLTTDH